MPKLKLIKAPGMTGSGQSYLLSTDEVVLGREDVCGIVVPNHAVSRKHARIIRSNGQFFIEDLKSRNKTLVNNREITERHALKHDDRIKICDFQYLFQDDRPFVPHMQPLPGEYKPPVNLEDTQEDELKNDSSSIEHMVAKGSDTDLLNAQPKDMLRALLDISISLSKALELEPLLSTIAETSFNVFRQADRCFIILAEDKKLIPKIVKVRRQGSQDDHRFSKTIVRKCMESMAAYLSEDASSDVAMGAAQSIAEFRIRSVMCVPLTDSDGKAIGAMQLDTQDRGKKFKKDDLNLLLIVANLATVAIEKATLHESTMAREKLQKEIEIARKVQLDFLPRTLPVIAGYEFFSDYSAAQTVGGDYYTFIPLPDGRIAILLGDVAGKGVPAALLMAKLSAEARYCMMTQPDVPTAIQHLSDQLIRGGIGDRFVTMAALVLNPVTHRVTIVNAGHLNPMRFRATDRTLVEVITHEQSGLALGIVESYPYEAVEIGLLPGDTLLLFTDGVTDATSPAPADAMFGYEGLTATIMKPTAGSPIDRPKALGERLVRAVRQHANGRPQTDDIAIVCFGRLVENVPPTGPHAMGGRG
ncbi:SpoIIE family protein phosphatase [Limnoglobus roseus]|uniref:Serine/threonine-protein phosphatase n=1 Tax=Limnoglobus roseus TaxID=2598579 RepID=A0A5C1AIY2_9BACT|nr:SpoIIE family protein phosphatase [Limnoglobus roseus]QEL19399.1 serine/threonine-protein phosphatase [Limnoglobus roseus]